ncbi:WG repeat-containing protein [Wukongibacter baidiensis]
MKRQLLILIPTILILLMFTPTFADDSIKISVNGEILEVDIPMSISEGNTYVSIIPFCEKFDITVDVNNETGNVICIKDNQAIELTLGSKITKANNEIIVLDEPIKSIDGSIFVPIKLMIESIGLEFNFDKKSKTIEISDKESDVYIIEVNNKYGYISSDGEIIIEPIYDDVSDFYEGLAAVKQNGKYGYIDKSGKVIIPYQFDRASRFSEGYAKVWVDKAKKTISFIDRTGDIKFNIERRDIRKLGRDTIFDAVDYVKDGIVYVEGEKKVRYINTKGEDIITLPENSYGFPFSEGLALVSHKSEGTIFIDNKGNTAIGPFKADYYEHAGFKSFHNGMALVSIDFGEKPIHNYKYGVIDKKGNWIIEAQYEHLQPFSNGLAAFHENGKVGYINIKGEEIIEPQYELGSIGYRIKKKKADRPNYIELEPRYNFYDGLAYVRKNGEWLVINTNNEVVLNGKFDDFYKGLSIFDDENNGKSGVIDFNGNVIIKAEHDFIYINPDKELIKISNNFKGSYFDRDGNKIFDPMEYK